MRVWVPSILLRKPLAVFVADYVACFARLWAAGQRERERERERRERDVSMSQKMITHVA